LHSEDANDSRLLMSRSRSPV